MVNDEDLEFDFGTDERPSKSALKRAAKAKRALADRIVELSPQRVARLALTTELLAIVADTRGIRAHGARRRQLQYLAKQLRLSGLAEEIEAALDRLDSGTPPLPAVNSSAPKPPDPAAELIAGGDTMLERFIANHPDAERGRLRQLLRNAEHPIPERAERGRKALRAYLSELNANID
ncbi:MAG: ribosome biogenesis factor YjgA [Thiotrichales bacterium]